jgi:hypothetical protein
VHGRNEKYVQNIDWDARRDLEDLFIDGRIILKWFLRKEGRKVQTGLIWLRIGTSSGLL